jgi:hypothetical protein
VVEGPLDCECCEEGHRAHGWEGGPR